MRDNETRIKALSWWKRIPEANKKHFAKKYKPQWPFELVTTSSSTIEKIYTSEVTKKPLI